MRALHKAVSRTARCLIETLDRRLMMDALPLPFGAIDTGLTQTATAISQNLTPSSFTGAIVVAGTNGASPSRDQFLAGFTSSGTLSTAAFGTGGTTILNASGDDTVNATVASTSHIFTVGSGTKTVNGASQTVAVWHNYSGTGASFASTPGGTTTFTNSTSSAFHAVAFLPGTGNQTAIAVGEVTTANGTDFGIAEIGNPQFDPNAFPTTGLSADIDSSTDIASAVGIQTNGSSATRIIVAGTASKSGGSLIALVALNPNGTLDKSFGNNGQTGNPKLDLGTGIPATATAMVIEPDNSILIAGFENSTSDPASATAVFIHLLPNGSFDTRFGNNGISRPFDPGFVPAGVAVGEDGSISSVDSSHFLIARLASDGSPIGAATSPVFKLNGTGETATIAHAVGLTLFQGGAGTGDILYATGNVTFPSDPNSHIGLFSSQKLTPTGAGVDLTVGTVTAPTLRVAFTGHETLLPVNVTSTIVGASGAASVVDYFLSKNTTIGDSDDVLVGTTNVSGGATDAPATIDVPATLGSGAYHLIAQIHTADGTFENNAFNNTAIDTTHLITIVNKAEFSISAIGFFDPTTSQQIQTVKSGVPFIVALQVQNGGGPITDPVAASFEFSTTADFSTVAFTAKNVSPIPTGLPAGTSVPNFSVTVPAAAQLGNYFVRATINPKGATAVPEFNTANNKIISATPLTVTIGPKLPDYTAEIVSAPAHIFGGDRTSVKLKITNEGSVPTSKQIVVLLEMSRSIGGALLGSSSASVAAVTRVTPKLAPGKSQIFTISFAFPAVYSFGKGVSPKIFFVANVNAATKPVTELSNTNNLAYAKTATSAQTRFVDLEPTNNFTATDKISTITVTNKGSTTAAGTSRITLTSFDIVGNQLANAQVIQDGLFAVNLAPGKSKTYKFVYNSLLPLVGEKLIQAVVTANGIQSDSAFSKNLVAFT